MCVCECVCVSVRVRVCWFVRGTPRPLLGLRERIHEASADGVCASIR